MVGVRRQKLQRAIIWTRIRVQLGGGLACGLLPFFIALIVSPHFLQVEVVRVSLCASVLAILVGYYFFRSLVAFPGIAAPNYILPAFSSTYAAAVIMLLLLRLGYSRPLLVASYGLCVAWHYFIYFKIQRRSELTIGVVPFGDVESLQSITKVNWITLDQPLLELGQHDAITADFQGDLPDEWERFLADAALSGITVFHVKQLRESLTGRVEINRLSENAYGSLLPSLAYQTTKRAVDLAVALVLLVPVAILFVAIGVIIKLDSDGPVFFRQVRVGYRGAPFRMWKFRSMAHRPPMTEPVRDHAVTLHNDLRVTRVGRVLRRLRLDELPQILNILRGEMSWIGPRPEAEVLSRWYERELPFYRYRHIVLPGISGWGQVNQGHVADVQDVLEKLHYDFFYISNFSLWLDVLIAIRTTRTVMTGFGSK